MSGEELKKLRTDKKLTQEQFADKLGTTKNRISEWENNKFKISKSYTKLLETLFLNIK
jgi:transcriptional regulator with XRE-family HTH domain